MHNNARETLTADAPRVGAQAVIAVAGAGSIGCYVGGCLGLAGVLAAGDLAGQRVGVLVSGGNVDLDRYAALLSGTTTS